MFRLLVCAGGTGGGVYPALAVAAALHDRAEVIWVGGQAGMEADLGKGAGLSFQAIPPAGGQGAGVPGSAVRASLLPQENRPSRGALGLDPAVRAVLVFGGSLGARSINLALWA